MSSHAGLTNVIRHLRRAAGDALGDPDLLDRYARGGDQEAFATLVRRYGPLVLGVAHRHLGDHHRAEDVFQATFLALARSAAKLGGRPVLANWLYTVALRQSRKARGRAARRQAAERAASLPTPSAVDPLAEITAREALQLVDDELARLPDRLRLPVLLCCVQGLSRDEAAQRLGWSAGAVKGRLERGRRRLAARLAAHGLAPAAMFSTSLTSVSIRADLLARTAAQAAAPWATTVPAAVAALAATAAPRALVALAVLTGGVLAVALGGWVVAARGPVPAHPAHKIPVAAGAPAIAVKPDPEDPLPPGATRRFGSPRYRHTTSIESLAVSPDGKVAVASSGTRLQGTTRAYNLTAGPVLFNFDSVPYVDAVAFSPDGKTVATWPIETEKPSIHLHDAATGMETARIPAPAGGHLLLFAPDGTHLVAGTSLIGLPNGDVVRRFLATGSVFAMALSPDGKQIVMGGYVYEKGGGWFARRWEVDTGRELEPLPLGNGGLRSLAYSPDGASIAVGGEYGKVVSVTLFDSATGKERSKISFPGASLIRSVAFSPDGKTLAASAAGTVRLFDTASGKERLKIDRPAFGLRFSPDGKILIGAAAGTIHRWDVASGKSLIPDSGESPVAQIAVTADGKRVVSLGTDGDGHIWDARTGEHQRRVNMACQRGFALSPDGRYLVWPEPDEAIQFQRPDEPNTIHTGSRLRMMDVASGALVERFGGFEGDPYDLYFTDGGKKLVTVDHWRRDAGVRVWDVTTGKVERLFAAEGEPGSRVFLSRLSPDGKVLAVVYQGQARGLSAEAAVKLLDLATRKELARRPPLWFDLQLRAFAPDRATIAGVNPEGTTVYFEDVATGQVLGEFKGLRDRVTALAFGPDGQLFTGSPDATVLAWDPQVVKPNRK